MTGVAVDEDMKIVGLFTTVVVQIKSNGRDTTVPDRRTCAQASSLLSS